MPIDLTDYLERAGDVSPGPAGFSITGGAHRGGGPADTGEHGHEIEVAVLGGAGVVALGLALQLLLDAAPGGEAVGDLAAQEGDEVALAADGDQLAGGGGFGLPEHGSNLRKKTA